MKITTLLLLFFSLSASSQISVSLDSCYIWTRKNYPNLKQSGLITEITEVKKENLKTGWLPQVTLNGQATYQSDVPGIKIPIPNISIPSVSKDQYKVYAEFRQTIWDGGLIATNAKLEDKLLETSLTQIELELYKLNEQVSQAFFSALVVKNQQVILVEQNKVLHENLKMMESGIKNGTIEKSAKLVLEAEILNLEQSSVQLKAFESSALQVLSILTGTAISENHELVFNDPVINENLQSVRPEIQLFANQNSQLQVQSELLKRSRYPKIFGFGQLGYGKPGLNMLNNKFDSFYLAGIGISWNAFDWKKTEKQQQILKLQEQIILSQEKSFNQNLNVLLAQQKEQIVKFEKLIGKDMEMIKLRSEITRATESKLKNGTIIASEYIRDLQNETVAKLNFEMHTLQLKEAKEKYNIIKGTK